MSFLNKVFNMMGVEVDDRDDEDILEAARPKVEAYDDDEETAEINGKKNKVVKIHTTAQLKLVVMQPESFEEARDIAIHLKSKKPVIVNVERVDENECQRIIDFLSGVTYAIGGEMQKISKEILLVTPNSVKIMGDFKTELLSGGDFGFLGKEF